MQQYLEDRTTLTRRAPAASRMGQLGRRVLPAGLRPVVRNTATRLLQKQQRKKAAEMLASGISRLHLGCGATHLDGWINIDLFGTKADVYLDLRNPLPFEDASVDAVFHEHLIEHLPYAAALGFTRECARVLKPGGVLRMAMPDFRRYAESYLSGQGLIDSKRPNRPTRLLAFSEVFYEHGHLSMWDAETLEALATEAGLETFAESAFGTSILGTIDSPNRELESLYVEATKSSTRPAS